MARSKSPVAAKDLKAYPVDDYPYVFVNRHGDPTYCRSYPEAIARMRGQLETLQIQFRALDSDIVARVGDAIAAVSALPWEGGEVDVLISEHHQMRYRSTLTLRETVA